ncbi:MAG: NAD(P)H-dependent oxidoreductase [Pseudomonadota bacterium]
MTKAPLNILLISASGRRNGSVTRQLTDEVIQSVQAAGQPVSVTHRDLASGAPLIDEDWISANFTPLEKRSADQAATLSYSDGLVAEVKAADLIILGAPMYNFSVSASLKAWIDQIARAGLTFRYTQDGPIGLVQNKRALIVMATGGVKIGSAADFATSYLRHLFGFIGITDVTVVGADVMGADTDKALAQARTELKAFVSSLRDANPKAA